jgi:hypothetical protein
LQEQWRKPQFRVVAVVAAAMLRKPPHCCWREICATSCMPLQRASRVVRCARCRLLCQLRTRCLILG